VARRDDGLVDLLGDRSQQLSGKPGGSDDQRMPSDGVGVPERVDLSGSGWVVVHTVKGRASIEP
jgi:hypothetical protein